MGGTGLRPVVSGVPPETVARRDLALVSAHNQQWMVTDEIRRAARATILKTRHRTLPVRRRASGLEELLKFLPRTFAGAEAVAFHFLIERERLAAGGRELRAAAALAAARHQHERFHSLDERPGFHVGHAHV